MTGTAVHQDRKSSGADTRSREELLTAVRLLEDHARELVTSGHDLVAAQTQLQSLLHRSSDAIIQFDTNGTITSFNSAAERIFGYKEIELMYGPADDLFLCPEEISGNIPAWLTRYSKTIVNQYDNPLIGLAKNGKKLLFEVSVALIEPSNLIMFDDFGDEDADNKSKKCDEFDAFLCILHDITERKAIGEELRQHREELEALVDEQTVELREKNKELEQFSSIASHDLKSPVRRISQLCKWVKDDSEGKLNADSEKYLGWAIKNADRLTTLIEDLLEYSRVGKMEKRLNAVELGSVLECVLENLHTDIEEVNASIHIETMPTVLGDETLLIQLLQNLIANAIKFRGEKDPSVNISAHKVVGAWQISVSDNGIGIKSKHQPLPM